MTMVLDRRMYDTKTGIEISARRKWQVAKP